jgi:hypothetical protein
MTPTIARRSQSLRSLRMTCVGRQRMVAGADCRRSGALRQQAASALACDFLTVETA